MKEKAKEMLEDLLQRSNDIKSAIIASSDGLPITEINSDNKATRLSAMAAAALGLGKQVTSTAFNGELKELMISGDQGQVLIYSISTTAVMVVITDDSPNVAMVNWEVQKTISQLVNLVKKKKAEPVLA